MVNYVYLMVHSAINKSDIMITSLRWEPISKIELGLLTELNIIIIQA